MARPGTTAQTDRVGTRRRTAPRRRRRGFSLVELLLALAAAVMLTAALGAALRQSFQAWEVTRERAALEREADFAMARMLAAVHATSRLLVPLGDDVRTPIDEGVRDVLAVALDPLQDLDGDGFADADNDRDGKVDEDPGHDLNADGKAGLRGIDDDGDGKLDEGGDEDDDEDSDRNDDAWNGLDDDGDGRVDEDPKRDANNDGKPGISGVDDDGDTLVDEGANGDDDEDGTQDEDWIDSVVFYRQGTRLRERLPDLHAPNGQAFTEHTIAENVSLFRVERLTVSPNDRAALVDLQLELTGPRGGSATRTFRARVGAGR